MGYIEYSRPDNIEDTHAMDLGDFSFGFFIANQHGIMPCLLVMECTLRQIRTIRVPWGVRCLLQIIGTSCPDPP